MQDATPQTYTATGIAMREREIETTDGTARISFLVCKQLEQAGFANAFSTRLGGVSRLPTNALNLAFVKADDKENVVENRRRFLKAIAAETATVVTARQTHSIDRCFIETDEQARGSQPNCDSMTTKLTGALLAIQTADCLPVLIADPKSGAMTAIHAGWRGTAGRITERTVADLMLLHGANPRDCIAALGPAACVECYEVGEDVIERYKKEFGYWRKLFVNFKEGPKAHLDVRAANVQQLKFCGFDEDRIHVADVCTMHHNELFFSYRREGKAHPSGTGRLLSVVGRIGAQ
ncbi:MAG TPA: peptidoglycan editing factor PgeF [Blastocatellia bacterium]|nr:peptidoglycan editing factor PgeF [Blastocatellia bacterium]